jgi:hypothetical protein
MEGKFTIDRREIGCYMTHSAQWRALVSTDKNYVKPQSGWKVSRPSFEFGIYRTGSRIILTTDPAAMSVAISSVRHTDPRWCLCSYAKTSIKKPQERSTTCFMKWRDDIKELRRYRIFNYYNGLEHLQSSTTSGIPLRVLKKLFTPGNETKNK